MPEKRYATYEFQTYKRADTGAGNVEEPFVDSGHGDVDFYRPTVPGLHFVEHFKMIGLLNYG